MQTYGLGEVGLSTWNEYITHAPPPGGAAPFAVNYEDFIVPFPPAPRPGVLPAVPVELIIAIVEQATNPLGLSAAMGALRNQLSQAALNCPDSKFVLVGYSYGAWVIQRYLHLPAEPIIDVDRSHVVAVLLYGDPTWPELPELSPRLGIATSANLGYRSKEEYIPTTVPADRFMSLCLSYDLNPPPVGTRYTAYDPICLFNPLDPLPFLGQNNLFNCFGPEILRPPDIQCPHRQYHLRGGTKQGADFLATITGANSCPGPGCAR